MNQQQREQEIQKMFPYNPKKYNLSLVVTDKIKETLKTVYPDNWKPFWEWTDTDRNELNKVFKNVK